MLSPGPPYLLYKIYKHFFFFTYVFDMNINLLFSTFPWNLIYSVLNYRCQSEEIEIQIEPTTLAIQLHFCASVPQQSPLSTYYQNINKNLIRPNVKYICRNKRIAHLITVYVTSSTKFILYQNGNYS